MNVSSHKRAMMGAAVAAAALCAAGSAVAVLPMGAVAAAESGWASRNVYCYLNDGKPTSTSRDFIRNVHVYPSGDRTFMDFVRERQTWDGDFVRGTGESVTVDVTDLGGPGVLAAFNLGGDADWVCRTWASKGYESGRLTTET